MRIFRSFCARFLPAGRLAAFCCTCKIGRVDRSNERKLEEVREALTGIGVRGMMVTEIKGFGAQSGHTEIYRGAEYAVNYVPKIKLEIAVTASMADQVIETITKTARTGKIGDGKIFALDITQALRVRTGEINEDAL